MPERTQLTLLDIHPASNAPKVPYWAKLGDFWRGIIPFQGGQAGLLQKLGSVTRVIQSGLSSYRVIINECPKVTVSQAYMKTLTNISMSSK